MKAPEVIRKREEGQTLILFSLMIVVLSLFVVLVADAGFFMVERRNAQNTMDAAALAGAMELPDNAVLAEHNAREYAERNGMDGDSLIISFKCTSTLVQFCDPAKGRYDTITVDAKKQAPAFFGPLLSLVGAAESCWNDGCYTHVHAAACRGACTNTSEQLDVVVTIDHTASMTATDMQNAKDGALALFRIFNHQSANLALGVTPPVTPTDHCDSINNWTDARTWLPVTLNNSYQTSPGVLNAASALVQTVTCLDRPSSGELSGPHTDLAEPMKAAMNELKANGRPNAKKSIVFFTDGAANVYGEAGAGAAAGALGPCHYAYMVANQAKAAGYEVFTIAYGADDRCTRDSTSSPWYNRTAVDLLNAMATDDAHFFNAPRTADLDPVFQSIGVQLTGGSKLVE